MIKRLKALRHWLGEKPLRRTFCVGFFLFTAQLTFLCFLVWHQVSAQNYRGAIIPAFCAGLVLGLLGITYTMMIAMRTLAADQARHEAVLKNLVALHLRNQEVDRMPQA